MERQACLMTPVVVSSATGECPTISHGGGCVTQQLVAHSKRKEKARIAARLRRSQEANIISEMANELHITQEKMRRIDKTTIIKLAIDYIKAYEILCREQPRSTRGRHEDVKPMQPRRLIEHIDLEQFDNSEENQENLCSASQDHHLIKSRKIDGNADKQRIYSDDDEDDEVLLEQQQQQQLPLVLNQIITQETIKPPSITTASIFEPKTTDNTNSHYLMIENEKNGESSFVLKPDTEIQDEDDLTHLAPSAGVISIPLDVDPLDNIVLDDKTASLFDSTLDQQQEDIKPVVDYKRDPIDCDTFNDSKYMGNLCDVTSANEGFISDGSQAFASDDSRATSTRSNDSNCSCNCGCNPSNPTMISLADSSKFIIMQPQQQQQQQKRLHHQSYHYQQLQQPSYYHMDSRHSIDFYPNRHDNFI